MGIPGLNLHRPGTMCALISFLRTPFIVSVLCAILSVVLGPSIADALTQQHDEETEQIFVGRFDTGALFLAFYVACLAVVVLRALHGQVRFQQQCSCVRSMQAEWFGAASSLVAFCRFSTADGRAVMEFQHKVLRLFSLLHAASLVELARRTPESARAPWELFDMELIDAQGLDKQSIHAVQEAECVVELVFQWLQILVVDNVKVQVLSGPPSLLTRGVQRLGDGLCNFHHALEVANSTCLRPCVQIADVLLLLHSFVTPIMTSALVDSPLCAGIACFVQCFALWSINAIAVRFENPSDKTFGDLYGKDLQRAANSQLLQLLRPAAGRAPELSEHCVFEEHDDSGDGCGDSEAALLQQPTGLSHQLRGDVQNGLLIPLPHCISTSALIAAHEVRSGRLPTHAVGIPSRACFTEDRFSPLPTWPRDCGNTRKLKEAADNQVDIDDDAPDTPPDSERSASFNKLGHWCTAAIDGRENTQPSSTSEPDPPPPATPRFKQFPHTPPDSPRGSDLGLEDDMLQKQIGSVGAPRSAEGGAGGSRRSNPSTPATTTPRSPHDNKFARAKWSAGRMMYVPTEDEMYRWENQDWLVDDEGKALAVEPNLLRRQGIGHPKRCAQRMIDV